MGNLVISMFVIACALFCLGLACIAAAFAFRHRQHRLAFGLTSALLLTAFGVGLLGAYALSRDPGAEVFAPAPVPTGLTVLTRPDPNDATNEDMIAAYSARDGAPRWQHHIGGSPLAVSDGLIFTIPFAQDRSHTTAFVPQTTLIAVRATEGTEQWRAQVTGTLWQLVTGDHLVIVLVMVHPPASGGVEGAQYQIVALDATTGAQAWTYFVPDAVAAQGMLQSPTIAAGAGLMCLRNADQLVTLRAADGAVLWQIDLLGLVDGTTQGNLTMTALPDSRAVYLYSNSSAVFALRASDGKLLWRYPPADADREYVISSPVESAGVTYFAADAGRPNGDGTYTYTSTLYAINTDDGALAWGHTFDTRRDYVQLTADSTTLYAADEGADGARIEAFSSAYGTQQWRRTNYELNPSGGTFSALVVLDGVIFAQISTGGGEFSPHSFELVAVRTTDGAKYWRLPGKSLVGVAG